MSSTTDFPTELVATVKDFQTGIANVERVLKPMLDVPLTQLQETRQMTVLDKAKVDCLSAFALNSLVWMWLRTKGVNPKESEIKQELERVKSAMVQVKSIQDKDKRNRVDVGAAKRIVSSGIWNPGEPKKRHSDAGSQEDEAPSKRSK